MMNMLLPRLVLFRKEVVQLWKAFWARETPLYLKAATLFTAFYLFNPFDIIPDVLPFIGLVDDIVLIPLMVGWIVSRLPVPAPIHTNERADTRRFDKTIDGTATRRN